MGAFGIVVAGTGPQVLNDAVIKIVKRGAGTARGIVESLVAGGKVVNNRITVVDKRIEYSSASSGMARHGADPARMPRAT